MDSLEIVILNDYASPTGGSTAVAMASALAMARRGLPVTFFTCVGPVAPELQAAPNLDVICLGQQELAKNPHRLRAAVEGLRNARAVRELKTVLASKSPRRTVVHAHTWTKALSPFALAAAQDMGFPLVVTLHDYFIACPNGGFFVHPTGQICQRAPLSSSCWRCHCDRRSYPQKLWRNLRTTLQNKMLKVPRRAAYYIAVSDYSLGILRPWLPTGVPARVIRNPLDCAKSAPVVVEKNRAFLFIGRFEPEKGVELFARAVRRTGVAGTFIGDGALRRTVQSICPDSRFTGWLPPDEIQHHLQTARALVFPSLWHETLGLAAIEATAAGVPVIVSDRCAAADYIKDNINGLHFSSGSVDSLSQRLMKLDSDGPLAARLGRSAYERYWCDPWTAESHISQLLEVYHEVTAARPASAETIKESRHEYIGSV